jgi:hypothetical protein
MPRIKRYFPVSHDINEDAEVWEFTEKFGDRAFRTWMEILRILDRNENYFHFTPEWLAGASRKVRQRPTKLRRQIRWIAAKRWLAIRETAADGSLTVFYAPNYAKYHNVPERNGSDKDSQSSPLRSFPSRSEPNQPKDAPAADPLDEKKKLDPRIKLAADRLYAARPELFPRMIVWIKRKEKEGYGAEAIAAALCRFESAAAAPEDWWPYLDKILARARTEMLQGESATYKRADPAQAGAVLRRIMEGLK